MIEYAPYGDFFNLIIQKKLSNEKLVRTFFHHLVQGLECLHMQGIAHLDIKLENLLLGKDFQLKIADFDVAQKINDEQLLSEGTENYRAPEIQTGVCTDFKAADIYSAGVCLFTLISRAFPFLEQLINGNTRSYEIFLANKEKFWKEMEGLLNNTVIFSDSLKELLNGMFAQDPSTRFSLEQVKKSRWYNKPVYPNEELKKVVEELFKL